MKVALLAARLPPACDGVGDHADRLAAVLAARGHDVVAITAGGAEPSPAYRLHAVGSGWGPAASLRAAALLAAMRPDVAIVEYTPFLYGPASPAPVAVLVAARMARIRSAIIVHEAFHGPHSGVDVPSWKESLLNVRDRSALTLADVIVVPSAARGEAIARRLPSVRDRIAVVPIGANVEAPSSYRRAPVRPARIVSFGVVAPRRRIERAVDAVARLTAGGRDVRLDIVGRIFDAAYATALERRARDAGIADRVALRGELSRAEVSSTFGTATVALHAAREGTVSSSGSVLALLAHAVPIVAVRTPHDDEVFAGALYYADDNPASIAAALRALVDEPSAAGSLVAAGLARWRARFSWDAVADRLLSTIAREGTHGRVVAA